MISDRVLLVDDEPRVGRSYSRALRRVVQLEQVDSGHEALEYLEASGPVAVIVADMRMARMDGIDLLKVIAERYPDTTRIMLTGNIDQRTASRAINEGGVFRYLTKPCDAWTFGEAVVAGVRKYQVRRAERELLDCRPDAAIQVARDLLQLINPQALERLPGLDALIRGLLSECGQPDDRNAQVLPLFALLGAGVADGADDGAADRRHQFTELAFRLATAVPGLARVAQGIRHQATNYDGSNAAGDAVQGEAIPFLGRVLRIALAFDQARALHVDAAAAFAQLVDERNAFDFTLLCALARHLRLPEPQSEDVDVFEGVPVHVRDLAVGMVVSEPVSSAAGAVLMSRGKVLDAKSIGRLRAFAEREQIAPEIRVFRDEEGAADDESVAAGAAGMADSA